MTQPIPKITISGQAASGKSTIAMLIQKALHDAGIDCAIHNEDTLPSALQEGQPARLERLKDRLQGRVIDIEQVYTRYTPT